MQIALCSERYYKYRSTALYSAEQGESGFFEIYIDNQAQTPVYFDNLTVTHIPSRILEINHYYPYGMPILEVNTVASSADEWNYYKYNAKELETALNLNWYDFHTRPYIPEIIRTPTPDPHAENYYSMSPYSMFGNNPIKNIDPTGMDWYSYDEEDENGVKQTRFMYSEDYCSQKDLDKAGIKGKYLGVTYKNDNTYFSLLGEQFNRKNENGSNNVTAEAVENIDLTLINYYTYENKADGFYNVESTDLRTRDMSVSRGVSRSYRTDANSFYFSYGDGQVKYNIATDMTGGYFDWGTGEMKPLTGYLRSEGSAVNSFIWKKGKNFDFVNWRFNSVDSWQSTKQRVERLFKNR